jgi:hypothetical protein
MQHFFGYVQYGIRTEERTLVVSVKPEQLQFLYTAKPMSASCRVKRPTRLLLRGSLFSSTGINAGRSRKGRTEEPNEERFITATYLAGLHSPYGGTYG